MPFRNGARYYFEKYYYFSKEAEHVDLYVKPDFLNTGSEFLNHENQTKCRQQLKLAAWPPCALRAQRRIRERTPTHRRACAQSAQPWAHTHTRACVPAHSCLNLPSCTCPHTRTHAHQWTQGPHARTRGMRPWLELSGREAGRQRCPLRPGGSW